MTIRAFYLRRAEFARLLPGSQLTKDRYLRLMALAGVDMACTTPLGIVAIVFDATTTKPIPWVSWANTHYNYSRVVLYPAIIWRSSRPLEVSMELTRWLAPFCAFVFFAFFGFAQEARRNYAKIFQRVCPRFLKSSTSTMAPVIPLALHSNPSSQQKSKTLESTDTLMSRGSSSTTYKDSMSWKSPTSDATCVSPHEKEKMGFVDDSRVFMPRKEKSLPDLPTSPSSTSSGSTFAGLTDRTVVDVDVSIRPLDVVHLRGGGDHPLCDPAAPGADSRRFTL